MFFFFSSVFTFTLNELNLFYCDCHCSGQRSDPSLSNADPECSPSPASTSLDHVASHSPDGNEEQHQHQVHHDLHGEGDNGGVVGDEGNSDTHGDVMAMPEYVNIFLQDEFRLDRYLIDGQTDTHPADTQADSNNNSSNDNGNTNNGTTSNGIVSNSVSSEASGSSLSQRQHPETVVVNVTEAITRPKSLKRAKAQKEPKRGAQQSSGINGEGGRRTIGRGGVRNSRVKSVNPVATSATCSVPAPATGTITANKKGGGWTASRDHQEHVLNALPTSAGGAGGLVCRSSHVIQQEAGLAGLVVLPSQTESSSPNPPLQLSQQQHGILHPHPHQHHTQHQQQQNQQQQLHHSQLTPTKGVVVSGLASSNGLPLTPIPSPSHTENHGVITNKTASPARPTLVVSSGASGAQLATHLSVPSTGVQRTQQQQQLLQRRHSVPLPQLHTLQQNNPHQQQSQLLTLVATSGNSNNSNGKIIIHPNLNGPASQVSVHPNISPSDRNITTSSSANNRIIVSAANPLSNRHLQIHTGGSQQAPQGVVPSCAPPQRVAQGILTSNDAPVSYESLVKENKFLKQALSEKIRSRQQQQHSGHPLLQVEETRLSPSPSSAASSSTSTPSPHLPPASTPLLLSSTILSPSSSASSSSSSPPQPTSSPASASVMPAPHTLQFLTDDIPSMSTITPSVKQECVGDPYGLDSSPFDHQYATYGSDLAHTVASLTNVCSGIPNMATSCAGGVQVTMATCDDVAAMTHHQHSQQHVDSQADNFNILGAMHHQQHLPSQHNHQMQSLNNLDLRQQHHQQHPQHQQTQQHHLQHQHGHPATSSNTVPPVQDAMIVQSAGGQFFQVLQPLQPLDHNQQQQQQQQHQHHMQVTSTNSSSSNANNNNGCTNGYYNYVYPQSSNSTLMDSDKQVVVERYLHQQHQYYNNGYTHFLNAENGNYNMKSPDSGFQEPCLSPNSSTVVVPKEVVGSVVVEGAKDKSKKKKSSTGAVGNGGGGNGGGGGAGGGNGGAVLTRQYSNSGSEKSAPKSPAIQKLEVNTTGYSYFLETPISTTQRLCEDRVTYLNKSQYYGLTLDFNNQERVIKCAVVKSVIVLTFREEKPMEEERKAWEFWHGRQHSYKQRILDIDTKNCQGVLPQNIEEISFNAVAVRWNPMEGPVRVNIAVHCLSTDFSNQKGVKGIPLHVQIDTYEQSPKDNTLVHRGYCQIKAFCDKGAERKTRDEERRKAAKGKSEELVPALAAPISAKSRKKQEEAAFHEPCERSEFYSMADTVTPPVFFNPLHESSEFIHKSLSLGVIPSQDEEISSLPTSLELPDSCDDFYNATPAKRARVDSSGATKDSPKVLLYVRERHETVYTALMLDVPSLHGLLRAIEQKYAIAPSKVKNFYKKSRKGILVKMDDNIVRHFSHESTFIMEMNTINDDRDFEIILIEIDPVIS
ncbi:DNA-binding protein elf-1 [Plakobranchus ocellatus]|uniref:DNA-binding protein elf-1 n=1 Tax=Plakobranchus ocellatus TaxID=259542 RepID=A0AAV4B4K7_9GAST|nr:DNA-binding protein elf-1 [Plakobranchus ocellatus]